MGTGKPPDGEELAALQEQLADARSEVERLQRAVTETVRALEGLRDKVDVSGQLRYNMPTSEKERIALMQELPGAPKPTANATGDAPEAQRYAAGYLFAKAHPDASKVLQPWIDRMHTGWAGDSPELQSWATTGANAARTHEKPARSRLGSLADILASVATGGM